MPDYNELSSEKLMPLIGTGDRHAFACLMSRHLDMVFRVAFRYLGNDAEAEDISQEVFLRVWRKANDYTADAKLTTWLYAITANLCKSQLRSLWRRHVKLTGDAAVHHDMPDPAPMPGDILFREETEKKVKAAIDSLPGNQRMALILKRYEDLSYADIAEIMGCSVAAVESLIFRAMTTLRGRIVQ